MTRIITALDMRSEVEALALADRLDPALTRAKVGKELFTRAGPSVVKALHELGFQVFLDLKFHDIPNTVAGALRAAVDLGVWMVDVHASGGPAMLEAARKAVPLYRSAAVAGSDATGSDGHSVSNEESGSGTRLVAITVLTSHDAASLAAVGVSATPAGQVRCLAELAERCGLDGVVCSPLEVSELRQAATRHGFLTVTPGVRPTTGVAGDDQCRVMTPAQAVAAGSDYLVIGRPITQAADPRATLEQIAAELAAVNSADSAKD